MILYADYEMFPVVKLKEVPWRILECCNLLRITSFSCTAGCIKVDITSSFSMTDNSMPSGLVVYLTRMLFQFLYDDVLSIYCAWILSQGVVRG